MPCLGPMYGWCKKIFAALSNLTFSDTKAYFSTFPQKKERRCGGGLSISESNSERSSPSHFGLVWEILFVKERSHRIPNRPRPLWIGPFGNLEKIAHKLEGIHPEGAECQFCMQSVTLVSIFYRRQVLQVQVQVHLVQVSVSCSPGLAPGNCQLVTSVDPPIPSHSTLAWIGWANVKSSKIFFQNCW